MRLENKALVAYFLSKISVKNCQNQSMYVQSYGKPKVEQFLKM